ncbi:FG-GAP repeat protein, partial [Chloroflexota bacterium]
DHYWDGSPIWLPGSLPEPSISETKLTASDAAADDLFGAEVAISGDIAVIGAEKDDDRGENSGSVYVFTREGSDWTEQVKLNASDANAGDYFGFSVSIDNDTIVVGAIRDDDGGEESGSAYVFVREGSGWTEQAKLMASDADAGDHFGFSVSIDGDTIVVGADLDGRERDIEDDKYGSAYVFVRNGSTWTEQAKLTAGDDEGVMFGESVSISGDTVVVGSSQTDTDAGEHAGAAYVYSRNGSAWTEQAKLTTSDAAAGDDFGHHVDIYGNTIVVGAGKKDIDTLHYAGAAYVYSRNGSVWTEQTRLTASDAGEYDRFGRSVAIHKDVIVVGAWYDSEAGAWYDDEAGLASGSAYIFVKNNSIWTERAKLTASDASTKDHFGFIVAISGNTVMVGAHFNDDAGESSGSVYIYGLP